MNELKLIEINNCCQNRKILFFIYKSLFLTSNKNTLHSWYLFKLDCKSCNSKLLMNNIKNKILFIDIEINERVNSRLSILKLQEENIYYTSSILREQQSFTYYYY